jgi:hypothetical protein
MAAPVPIPYHGIPYLVLFEPRASHAPAKARQPQASVSGSPVILEHPAVSATGEGNAMAAAAVWDPWTH